MNINNLLLQYGIKPTCTCDMPPGWFKLVKKLLDDLIANGWDKKLGQIKEKFGGLRVYIDNPNKKLTKIITDAEVDSYKICAECSNPGSLHEANCWIITLCDSCATKAKAKRRAPPTFG